MKKSTLEISIKSNITSDQLYELIHNSSPKQFIATKIDGKTRNHPATIF